MADTDLRLRVERMLRRDFRSEDLSRLFLALRDRSGGRETVREVGDFVAHRGDRIKGIVTNTTRDFFTVIRFQFPKTPTVSLDDLPKNIMDILYATFRRIDDSLLRDETRLKRLQADRALKEIAKRLLLDNGGKLFLSWPTEEDVALVRCLITRIISKPAFDGHRLFNEFRDALIANQLLRKSEQKAFAAFKATISLFAISQMHLCDVDLGDGTKATLNAMADGGSGGMSVSAKAAVDFAFVAGSIFTSDLRAPDHCEASLVIELKPGPAWSCDIELNQAQKLTKLV